MCQWTRHIAESLWQNHSDASSQPPEGLVPRACHYIPRHILQPKVHWLFILRNQYTDFVQYSTFLYNMGVIWPYFAYIMKHSSLYMRAIIKFCHHHPPTPLNLSGGVQGSVKLITIRRWRERSLSNRMCL